MKSLVSEVATQEFSEPLASSKNILFPIKPKSLIPKLATLLSSSKEIAS
jgi:hypothetical protein